MSIFSSGVSLIIATIVVKMQAIRSVVKLLITMRLIKWSGYLRCCLSKKVASARVTVAKSAITNHDSLA